MNYQDTSPSPNSLKWNKIIPTNGFHHCGDRTYSKALLYRHYILFFGRKEEEYGTKSNHVLVYDLERDEWNMMIMNGESELMSSEGFSIGYYTKECIFLSGGSQFDQGSIKKGKNEKIVLQDSDSSEEEIVPVKKSTTTKPAAYVSGKKTPAKAAMKTMKSSQRGVLEMLAIEDSGSGIFSSNQSGQLLRGRWEEPLPDVDLPCLQYHTANIFENKIYLVGGAYANRRLNRQIGVINLSGGNSRGSFSWKEIDNSGERVFGQRQNHSSFHYRDKIYYFGGFDMNNEPLNDMWAFNPYTLQWQEIEYQSLIPTPRMNCLIQTAGENVFIAGGNTDVGNCGDFLTFNLSTNVWKRRNNGLKETKNQQLFLKYENTLIFGQDFELYCLDIGLIEKASIGEGESNFRISDRQLFTDKTYADITFNVDGKQIKAHKAIVASRSSHLQNMFTSGMKETNSPVIDIPDMKADTFNGFLEYLYCGELDFTEETAVDLLKLSDKFCAAGLRRLCEKYLITVLKGQNVMSLTNLADFCGASKLKEAGLMYMAANFDEVFEKQDIRSLPSTLIMELFKYKANK